MLMTLSRSCVSPNSTPGHKMPNKQKVIQENDSEADLSDKGINGLEEIPNIMYSHNLTRLTLSHNKIKSLPPSMANLSNLEQLNLCNNQIEELPTSLSSMTRLKVLNLGLNRLHSLPRGFGAFPALEVLDLTYNFLSEKSLPANFFMLETLRALYLADNEFEYLSPDIGSLKNLQILVLRDNDLIVLPTELGLLIRLRELHIQNNRLTVLPPELGQLDLCSHRSVVRMEGNPWVPPIADQLQIGVTHVIEYIRTDTYRFLYGRHSQTMTPSAIPPRNEERRARKLARNKQNPYKCN
ncbi:ras suppressor protein 1-like [Oppia nitens]|uniref:ras suppressor protein 1-like n=1 Tax=Oppia nitens TaxID=1686743 RepID=UPI0023DB98D5|nr:ras suppressor protein 1-like [Oppia nitens]